ncbi:MAG: PepSY-like domain-containing protein [Flavisolibacter sp.]
MKTSRRFSILFVSIFLMASFSSISIFAQIRQVPQPVQDSFTARYPHADSVDYVDNLLNVHVRFMENGEHMKAIFSNKGEWRQTEKILDFDKLNADVQDGFQKSKYSAEWKVKEAAVVYLAGGSEEYRLRIGKNDLQKKYLFFSKNGRLLRETMTI